MRRAPCAARAPHRSPAPCAHAPRAHAAGPRRRPTCEWPCTRARRYAALEHAASLLGEDGLLGVADFYVSRKHPPAEMAAHSWLQRTFWPTWFAMDDVRLSPDHLPYIQSKFEQLQLDESASMVPYVGWVLPKVPCYRFLGRPRKVEVRIPSEPYFSLPALSHVFLAKIRPKSKGPQAAAPSAAPA